MAKLEPIYCKRKNNNVLSQKVTMIGKRTLFIYVSKAYNATVRVRQVGHDLCEKSLGKGPMKMAHIPRRTENKTQVQSSIAPKLG